MQSDCRDGTPLNDTEHDRADKGEGEICGHHAEFADESHGSSPWLIQVAGRTNANK